MGTACNKWLKKALMIVIEKSIQSFIQFIPFNTGFQVFSQYSITGRWDNSYYDLVLNLFYGNYLCSFEYQWKNTNQEKRLSKSGNCFEILFLRRNNKVYCLSQKAY